MSFKAEAIIIAVLLGLVAALGVQAAIYRGNAIVYKAQRDDAKDKLKLANDTIEDMTTRQRDVAALDAKYTKELASAKDTISDLRRDVDSGKRRLQLNATCENQPTSSGSLGDAATARLNDTAQRDYFTLRERIATITGQVNYLQQYITEQCMK